jgi:hypothetical protein
MHVPIPSALTRLVFGVAAFDYRQPAMHCLFCLSNGDVQTESDVLTGRDM